MTNRHDLLIAKARETERLDLLNHAFSLGLELGDFREGLIRVRRCIEARLLNCYQELEKLETDEPRPELETELLVAASEGGERE